MYYNKLVKDYKMKSWQILFVFIVSTIFYAISCTPVSSEVPQVFLPDANSYTQEFLSMDNSNIQFFEQIKVFHIDVHENTKLELGYVLKDNKILVCCSSKNELIAWDVYSEKVIYKYILSNFDIFPYEFDTKQSFLLGKVDAASNDVPENSIGLFIWDTNTGKVIRCIGAQCTLGTSIDFDTLGATLQLDGRLVIEFDDSVYSLYNVQQGSYINESELPCVDCGYIWRIGDGDIAYDVTNNRYVVTSHEGRMQMYYIDLSDPQTLSVSNEIVLSRGIKQDWQPVYATEFDPLGKYLAIARGDKLKVLEVREKTSREKIEISISNVIDLMFDKTGSLLFIATQDKLTILDIPQESIVAEYKTPEITAFDISDDNRLLTWISKDGNIYVWGIPMHEEK